MLNAHFENEIRLHNPEKNLDRLVRFSHWMRQVAINCTTNDPIVGVREMVLLSNSQRPVVGLDGYGLTIKGYEKVGR